MPTFAMEISVDKRERSSNFTFEETELLVNLVEERKTIIECKKTDAVTNKSKELEWKELTILYNSKSSQFRTTKMLRSKWEALKKITRKELALLSQSDGVLEEKVKKNPWSDRIIYIMSEGINEIPRTLDEEQGFEARSAYEEKPKKEIPSTSVQYLTHSVPLTSTERSSITTELKTDTQWETWEPTLQNQPDVDGLEIEENLPNEYVPFISTGIEENIPDSSNRHRYVKKKKRGSLSPSNETNKKFSDLVDKKLELIQMQIDLLQKESEARMQMEKEKHSMQMKILEAELRLKEKLLNANNT